MRPIRLLYLLVIPFVLGTSGVALYFTIASKQDTIAVVERTLWQYKNTLLQSATTKLEHQRQLLQISLEDRAASSDFLESLVKNEEDVLVQNAFGESSATIELFFVHLIDNNRYIDLSFINHKAILHKLVDTNNDDGIVKLTQKHNHSLIYQLESIELLNPISGRVLGRLYAGIPLHENPTLLNQIKTAHAEHLCLLSDSKILSSTTIDDPINWGCSGEILEQTKTKGYVRKAGGVLLASSLQEGIFDINLLVRFSDEELARIDKQFQDRVLLIVGLMVLITLVTAVMIKRYIDTPLLGLVHYAESLSESKECLEPRSIIFEFVQIAERLKLIIGKLHSKEQKLNQSQQELIRLNVELQNRIDGAIEEIRQKDAILYEESKRRAMVELLVDLAHQWRQPLQVVSFEIEMIEDYLDKPNIAQEKITKALNQIETLSNTITRITSFYEKGHSKEISLLEALRLTDGLIGHTLHQSNITIKEKIDSSFNLKLPSDIWVEIISAMVLNVCDIAGVRKMRKGEICIYATSDFDSYMIKVEDNAGGIDDDMLPMRLFEPYTTSHFKSRDKGLGLYTIWQIVKIRLNGTISAHNIENGAQFIIRIPHGKE